MKDVWFPGKNKIVRSAIRQDLLFFGLPAWSVWCAGLWVSFAGDGGRQWKTVAELVRNPVQVLSLGPLRIAGLFLALTGLAIAVIAASTLGRSYASIPLIWRNQRLKTHGIYRFVRHPLYTGVLIACHGVPIYASSLGGFLIILLLIPLFLYRIKVEEGLLTEQYGEAYRLYVSTTKRLIPFVY